MNVADSYMGLNNFVWWFGVVEDRQDPLKAGRVKVRIYSWHNAVKSLAPTEDLPWAQITLPVNENYNVAPPREGAMVFGFYMDGIAAQFPIIVGIVPGIPEENGDTSRGFFDPRDSSQLASSPFPPQNVVYQNSGEGVTVQNQPAQRFPYITNEPQTSRVARNENISATPIGQKQQNYVSGVTTSLGNSWNEPSTPYAAQYPYDRAIESESGHLVEIDDTPGAERLHTFHRSGTFEEIGPDGTKVTKVTKDNYEIIMGNDYVYVMGDVNITVQGNCNLLVEKDANVKIDGNLNTTVLKDYNLIVDGTMNVTITKDYNVTVSGNTTKILTGSFIVTVGGLYNISITNMYVLTALGISLNATGDSASGFGDITSQTTGSLTNYVTGSITNVVTGSIDNTILGSVAYTVTGTFTVDAASIYLSNPL